MALKQLTSTLYPWVTHLWSPYVGCQHNCIYCYTQYLPGHSTTPLFIEKELETSLGSDRIVFVCSTGDLFGEWVPDKWISKILQHCHRFHNTYLFQTKNPGRYMKFLNDFPSYTIFGTTIETNRDTRLISGAPPPLERVEAMQKLGPDYEKMVSIEPILEFDLEELVECIQRIGPKFVSIGRDSKGHDLNEPSMEKAHDLIERLSVITEVTARQNLTRLTR